MPNNKIYSKEDNKTRSRIQSNNSKETRRPQFVVNKFPRHQTLQRHQIVSGERPYIEATNPRVYNSNNIIVFSDSTASLTWNIRSNFNNFNLEPGSIIFLVPLQTISCSILNQILEKVN